MSMMEFFNKIADIRFPTLLKNNFPQKHFSKHFIFLGDIYLTEHILVANSFGQFLKPLNLRSGRKLGDLGNLGNL